MIFDEKQMQYIIFGEENCPTTNRLHWQTFVYFYNAKTFKQCKNYFFTQYGTNPHICKSNGTNKQNIAYCSKDCKDCKYFEFGKEPTDTGGSSVNLKIAIEKLKNKEITLKEICNEHSDFFHTYKNTLKKSILLHKPNEPRTERTTCDWYFGKSGCGKSRFAFIEAEKYKSVYVACLNDIQKWWDGYEQQELVIFDNYRAEIKLNTLLNLADRFEMKVPIRNIGGVHFNSKRIIITCPFPYQEMYCDDFVTGKEDINQVNKRINLIEVFNTKNTKTDFDIELVYKNRAE